MTNEGKVRKTSYFVVFCVLLLLCIGMAIKSASSSRKSTLPSYSYSAISSTWETDGGTPTTETTENNSDTSSPKAENDDPSQTAKKTSKKNKKQVSNEHHREESKIQEEPRMKEDTLGWRNPFLTRGVLCTTQTTIISNTGWKGAEEWIESRCGTDVLRKYGILPALASRNTTDSPSPSLSSSNISTRRQLLQTAMTVKLTFPPVRKGPSPIARNSAAQLDDIISRNQIRQQWYKNRQQKPAASPTSTQQPANRWARIYNSTMIPEWLDGDLKLCTTIKNHLGETDIVDPMKNGELLPPEAFDTPAPNVPVVPYDEPLPNASEWVELRRQERERSPGKPIGFCNIWRSMKFEKRISRSLLKSVTKDLLQEAVEAETAVQNVICTVAQLTDDVNVDTASFELDDVSSEPVTPGGRWGTYQIHPKGCRGLKMGVSPLPVKEDDPNSTNTSQPDHRATFHPLAALALLFSFGTNEGRQPIVVSGDSLMRQFFFQLVSSIRHSALNTSGGVYRTRGNAPTFEQGCWCDMVYLVKASGDVFHYGKRYGTGMDGATFAYPHAQGNHDGYGHSPECVYDDPDDPCLLAINFRHIPDEMVVRYNTALDTVVYPISKKEAEQKQKLRSQGKIPSFFSGKEDPMQEVKKLEKCEKRLNAPVYLRRSRVWVKDARMIPGLHIHSFMYWRQTGTEDYFTQPMTTWMDFCVDLWEAAYYFQRNRVTQRVLKDVLDPDDKSVVVLGGEQEVDSKQTATYVSVDGTEKDVSMSDPSKGTISFSIIRRKTCSSFASAGATAAETVDKQTKTATPKLSTKNKQPAPYTAPAREFAYRYIHFTVPPMPKMKPGVCRSKVKVVRKIAKAQNAVILRMRQIELESRVTNEESTAKEEKTLLVPSTTPPLRFPSRTTQLEPLQPSYERDAFAISGFHILDLAGIVNLLPIHVYQEVKRHDSWHFGCAAIETTPTMSISFISVMGYDGLGCRGNVNVAGWKWVLNLIGSANVIPPPRPDKEAQVQDQLSGQ